VHAGPYFKVVASRGSGERNCPTQEPVENSSFHGRTKRKHEGSSEEVRFTLVEPGRGGEKNVYRVAWKKKEKSTQAEKVGGGRHDSILRKNS